MMKDLSPLQRMLKMGENKKLQSELQKLHTCKEEYLKIVKPQQKEVSNIALNIDAKITDFKATQTIVASLLEDPITTELVDTAQECVEQIERDLTGLKTSLDQFKTKVKKIVKEMKTASGSGMSHK